MTERGAVTVIEGCAIATMDEGWTEHVSGHIVVEDNVIAAVGAGPPPHFDDARRIDAAGCLATPGLINCHHHLYQWLTRGLAQQANLFEWLQALYPVWAHIDRAGVETAARAGLAALALSGCSTSTDHHYVWPHGGEDLLGAEIDAAARIGLRFHPCRGAMDLGQREGGLPPDDIVEDRDAILSATEEALDAYHDDAFDSMLRVAIAPCSPFSVTAELMTESAELARARNVRLHTHLAETTDEDDFCRERFGMRPVEYLDDLGWLGPDVWLAHCVQLDDDDIKRLATTSTGVAHCPSSNARLGAGIAPVRRLISEGVAVGLGVDGSASNEAGELRGEMRQALALARASGGPQALTVRAALALATTQGARCLGRADALGSLEPGKLADICLWRRDDLWHAGTADPVAALVLGAPRPVDVLMVNGEVVVDGSALTALDEAEVAAELTAACADLRGRAEVKPGVGP
jgi:cytosine/adenosine deaminase-related metal-dependent hydrolase